MKQLLNQNIKFDLIITSPPYNIKDFHANQLKYSSYKGNNMNEDIYQSWQIECMNLMYELLKDDGSLWYNHKVRIKKGLAIHPLEWIFKTKFKIKQEIIWNQKKGANVDKRRCFPFSERIYWLTKSPMVKLFNKNNLKDVWDIVPKTKRKKNGHPAVMELEVVQTIYDLFSEIYKDKQVLVLDPFAGIGTSFIPIINKANYKYIGFEIDNQYIQQRNKNKIN